METTRDPGLDGVKPFQFACHRCGHCCSGGSGFVWVEEDEIERMAAILRSEKASFLSRFVRVAVDPRTGLQRLALVEEAADGGRCALLVGKNTCSVYDARPEHCRTFPYWRSVLEDQASFEAARATCPGIAVVVDEATRETAFAALSELYAQLGACDTRSTCCLGSTAVERTFATALEVDYALATVAHGEPGRTADSRSAASSSVAGCPFDERRPIACRAHVDGEALLREVRRIERATNYPAAYAPLEELLKTRRGAP